MSGWPIVDSVQFARTHGELRTSASISDLKRLAQVVLEDEEAFDIRLEGFQDNDSRPCLRLRVNGTIRVTCQRCLEPLSIQLASDRRFVLVEREDDLMDLADEDDSVESLLAEDNFDVMVLVEDEILLQLPIAPTHDADACTAPEWAGQNTAGNSAFSVLGALTRTKN
jgi:uncharacterized protein